METEVERTRNTLLAGISHDFRTPLTTIVGSATTLIEQAAAIDEPHREQLLRTLLDEAQRLHVLAHRVGRAFGLGRPAHRHLGAHAG